MTPTAIKLHKRSKLLEISYGESRKIIVPACLLIVREVGERLPAIESGAMAVVEGKAQGVIAHRANLRYRNLAFASLQHFLPTAVAAYLGRGGVDS